MRKMDLSTILFVCVEVLHPSQPKRVMSSMLSLSNHFLLDRLCPLSGTFFHQKLTTALLESAERQNDHRKYFMINLHERMLPTQRGSNTQLPDQLISTQMHIQLSHQGQFFGTCWQPHTHKLHS